MRRRYAVRGHGFEVALAAVVVAVFACALCKDKPRLDDFFAIFLLMYRFAMVKHQYAIAWVFVTDVSRQWFAY